MADTKTDTAASKADAPRAPVAVAKAADAAPKAAEKAAPAPVKEAAKATAQAATAPVEAAAATAKAATKAAPARRRAAKKAPAPKRTAAPAAAKTRKTTTTSINQGARTMKKEANQAADRFQAVFGDVNERAKTAIERNTRFAEEVTELTKGNVEALVASTKIAAKGVETIGQEVAEFSRKSFEDASAALKGFAEVKSPTDLFRLQSDFARNQFDMVVAETSKLSETVIKFAGQAAEPITSRYSVAAERVRSAVAF